MKIIPLSEGSFTVDKTKSFIPFDQSKDNLQERSQGSLLVEIQPFVIITERDILLLDTGLGFSKENNLQIYQNLAAHDIAPAAVTKVLLSHLHKDHSRGISLLKPDSNQRSLSFPNAAYYVNKQEFDYAIQKGKPSYMPEDFELLRTSANTIFTSGDGIIDNNIRYEVSGAHTPYHQVFHINEGDQYIFYGGDVAPQLQQMKNRFVAKYDYDGKKCMELRQQWWQTGQQQHWTFLFYHDIKTPSVTF